MIAQPMGEFAPVSFQQWQHKLAQQLPASQDATLDEATTIARLYHQRPKLNAVRNTAGHWYGLQPIFAQGEQWFNGFKQAPHQVAMVVTGQTLSYFIHRDCLPGEQDWSIAIDYWHEQKWPLYLDAGLQTLELAERWLKNVAVNTQGWLAMDPIGWSYQTAKPLDIDHLLHRAMQWHQQYPKLRTLLVRGLPYHVAGATPQYEVVLMLAVAIDYLRRGIALGYEPLTLGQAIAFEINVGSDLLAETARLRAMRNLWAGIIAQYGGGHGQQHTLHLLARNSWQQQTAIEPTSNLLRITTAGLAAVMGGAQGISLLPFDFVVQPPSEFSCHITGNIHHLLREEGHLSRSSDGVGGAFAIEQLTQQTAQSIWQQLQTLEQQGGIAALDAKQLQVILAQQYTQQAQQLATVSKTMVGINRYPLAQLLAPLPELVPSPWPVQRLSQPWEQLRQRGQALANHVTIAIDRQAKAAIQRQISQWLALAGLMGTATTPDHRQNFHAVWLADPSQISLWRQAVPNGWLIGSQPDQHANDCYQPGEDLLAVLQRLVTALEDIR